MGTTDGKISRWQDEVGVDELTDLARETEEGRGYGGILLGLGGQLERAQVGQWIWIASVGLERKKVLSQRSFTQR
jgi:hypothetical protein